MNNDVISKHIKNILNSEVNKFKDNYFNGDISNLEEQFLDFLYTKKVNIKEIYTYIAIENYPLKSSNIININELINVSSNFSLNNLKPPINNIKVNNNKIHYLNNISFFTNITFFNNISFSKKDIQIYKYKEYNFNDDIPSKDNNQIYKCKKYNFNNNLSKNNNKPYKFKEYNFNKDNFFNINSLMLGSQEKGTDTDINIDIKLREIIVTGLLLLNNLSEDVIFNKYDLFLDNLKNINTQRQLIKLLNSNNKYYIINKKAFSYTNNIFFLKLDINEYKPDTLKEFTLDYKIPTLIVFITHKNKLQFSKVLIYNKDNLFYYSIYNKRHININIKLDKTIMNLFLLAHKLSHFKGKRTSIDKICYIDKEYINKSKVIELGGIDNKYVGRLLYIAGIKNCKEKFCVPIIFGTFELELLKFFGKNIVDYKIKNNVVLFKKINKFELFKIYKSLEENIMNNENYILYKDYFKILNIFRLNKKLFNNNYKEKIELLKRNLFNDNIINEHLSGKNYKDEDVIEITEQAFELFYKFYYHKHNEKQFILMLSFLNSLIYKKGKNDYKDIIDSINNLLKFNKYKLYGEKIKNIEKEIDINHNFNFDLKYNVKNYIELLEKDSLILSTGEKYKITKAEYEILFPFYKINDKNINLLQVLYSLNKLKYNVTKERIKNFNKKDYKLKIIKLRNKKDYFLEFKK